MVEINLEQEILEELGKNMSADIDNEVMCDLLAESGWHKVRVNYNHDSAKILEWIDQNKTGDVYGRKHCWAFTEEKDAVWFALCWA